MAEPARRSPGRAHRAIAAVATGALAVLALGACSDTAGDTASTTPPTGIATTLPVASTPTTASSAPDATIDPDAVDARPTTVAPPVDGAAVLAAATAALATGYHFVTTVTVDGAETLTAEGDRIGTDSRLALTSNGATVAYIVTADGTFTSADGTEWEQLDTPPATSDPITALLVPSSVTVAATDGDQVTLAVVVPADALGVGGGGDATLQVVLAGGALASVDYSAATGTGQTALVHATISALADTTPITTPVTSPADG